MGDTVGKVYTHAWIFAPLGHPAIEYHDVLETELLSQCLFSMACSAVLQKYGPHSSLLNILGTTSWMVLARGTVFLAKFIVL